jgi:hypothetical protein
MWLAAITRDRLGDWEIDHSKRDALGRSRLTMHDQWATQVDYPNGLPGHCKTAICLVKRFTIPFYEQADL